MARWLKHLRWKWRLRKLPTQRDLDERDNQVFHAYVRYELAMAKHKSYLDDLETYRRFL